MIGEVTSYFTLATHNSVEVVETKLGDVTVVPREVKEALEDINDEGDLDRHLPYPSHSVSCCF